MTNLTNLTNLTTRQAPEGANYGYRWDTESQRYWAVTVPHEHGPFGSSEEAEEFLRQDAE